jgi:predicted dehydrogenase
MGSLHAQKVATLAQENVGVELAGVVDIDASRAEQLAQKVGTRAATDFRALIDGVDAAIVAVPTVEHFELVRDLLLAGCDVLVEKPMAATLKEAEGMLALARERGCVLQVGHLEWFNAAMGVIRHHIRRPRFAEVTRVGPFPGRATDIDVVRDLMIHDLDILQQILGEEPVQIEAVGVAVLTSQIDFANARLTFPGGCVATLTASRVSRIASRELRFFQSNGCFSMDLLAQSASIVHLTPADSNGDIGEVRTERLEVDRADALLDQLRDFVRAVQTREPPQVDPADALGALRTAVRVVESMPRLESMK